MRCGPAILVCSLVASVGLPGLGFADPIEYSREGGARVSPEEYPVFDRVVESKFLTSQTRVVVIERSTVRSLHPDMPVPPTAQWFEDVQPFRGRLPSDAVLDFVVKNRESSRLEDRFRFGVSVRFVTPDGLAEPEVRLAPRDGGWRSWRLQEAPQPPGAFLDRLAFSRVGLTLRGDEALVYVANERPDGNGAGFLMWLQRRGAAWSVIETETLWVAHSTEGAPSTREYDAS